MIKYTINWEKTDNRKLSRQNLEIINEEEPVLHHLE